MPLEPALTLPLYAAPSDAAVFSLEATCPRCGRHSHFTSVGEQRWTREVAQRANLPRVIRLYICGNCETTVSESAIL